MTPDRRHRFISLPATPGYLVRRWPSGLGAMQRVGFSRPCRRRDLVAISGWAGLPFGRRSGGRAIRGVSSLAVSRLMTAAARRKSGNHYHQPGHYAHVVMAAGILAEAANLSSADRAILVMAALVHDLDHHGRRSPRRIYAQERWSASRVRQILGGAGADIRMASRMEQLVLATAINDDALRLTILAADPLARLLADADLFGSVFYRRDIALGMTRTLKLEQGLKGAPEQLLAQFAAHVEHEGLQSGTGRRLYVALAASRRSSQNTVDHEEWNDLSNLL